MNLQINNAIRVPVRRGVEFYQLWLEFLSPLHNLSFMEMKLLSYLIRERFILSESISDESLIDSVLMGSKIRKAICNEAGMSYTYFRVLLGELRKKGALQGNRINRRYLPSVAKQEKGFKLMIVFEFTDNDSKT